MAAARSAMKLRDLAAARRHMKRADKAAFPEDRKSVDALGEVLDPWLAFWRAVGEGMGELKPGDAVVAAGQAATVIKATQDGVLLSVNGEEKSYPLATLPPDLVLKLAEGKLENSPMAACAKAAFLVMDAGGNPRRAADLCKEAASQGMPVGGILAEAQRLLTAGSAATASGKAAVPDATAQEAQRKTIREVLRDEYAKATTPAKKAELAGVLIRQGVETKDNLTVRYVLFAEARDMAVAGGNAGLLRTATEEMAKSYEVRPAGGAGPGAGPGRGRALSHVHSQGTWPSGAGVGRRGAGKRRLRTRRAAGKGRQGDGLQSHGSGHGAHGERRRREPALAEIAIRIGAKGREGSCPRPGECQGEPRLGDLQGELVKNDWNGGLPLFARGSDANLKAVAESELAGPPTAVNEIVKLAERWAAVAESLDVHLHRAANERALFWYARALPQTSGFTRTKLTRAMQELKDANALRGGSAERPHARMLECRL